MNPNKREVLFGFDWRRSLAMTLTCSLIGSVLLTGPASVRADDKPAPQDKPIAVDADYHVGIDDVLIVASAGHDEINQAALVLPDGTIRVNGVEEPIKAVGRTLKEIRADIFRELDKLYNNLILTVSIKEINSRMVYVSGTRASGKFPLRKGMRISGLMAQSNGIQGKTKNVIGTLLRDDADTGKKKFKLNMEKIIGSAPDPEEDLLLEPNDILIIDYKEDAPPPSYSVLGAVVKGGTFPMPLDGTPVSIARAVADAGGRTPQASLKKVTLLRKNQSMLLDLYPLLVDGKADVPEANLMMEDGDVLIIRELDAKYMVLGQVNKPSTIPIPEGRSINIQQALAEGGGPTQFGDLRKAAIMRMVGGKPTTMKVDLQALLTKSEKYQDIKMQDGDVLYVPAKGRAFNIGDITQPLWVLSLFGFRAFR